MTDTSIKHRGAKYDEKLNTIAIAKLFRKDIQHAVDSGRLPKGLKLSVRSERGRSIRVEVQRCPGILMMNPAYFLIGELNLPHQPTVHRFTREFRVVLQRIEDRLAAYQLDRSDHMSDYFNVNFYSSVREGEQANAELLALRAGAALGDLRIARANGATQAELLRMVSGHDNGGEMFLRVREPSESDVALLTDLNPLSDGERCVPGCPGWFVNSENDMPESCDECARVATGLGLQAVTDPAALDAWRSMQTAGAQSLLHDAS